MAKKRKKMVKSEGKKMKETKEFKKKEDLAGVWIVAGLFLGMGFGFIFDNIPAGIFLGLGAGFALMILTKLLKKSK
jgi:hypothetical protein